MLKTISNFYVVTLLFCTLTIGLILSSSHVSSASTTADAAVTVGSACTMTATVDTPHNAEIPNGTNRTEIGTTTLNTICNDSGGFAIYAVGYSNNEYGNNTMINQADSNITFNTGTATSGSNSNWSMKLSQVTTGTFATTIDNSFNNYHNVPATYTKVAHRDSATDAVSANPATGTSISATYQTFISPTQASGTYQGKVKYTMVHPASEIPAQPQTATSGCINYFANTTTAEGTMGCQSISASATSATLLASNFSRTGYGFAGWSDAYDYETNPNAHFYGPQEDITFTAGQYTGANNGLALYAVWVKSAGSLQDASKVATLCGTGTGSLTTAPTDGTANLASVSALTDERDNETYAIAKLADGKCWMIENLRLEAENTRTAEKQALAQGYGASTTYGNFSGLADAESASFSSTYSANSLYYSGTQSGTASINIGTYNYPGNRMPRYNNLNTQSRASNPTSNIFSSDNTDGGMYSYGNYYTWHAAIANLTYNGYNNISTISTSLCPTGWRLPRSGDKTRITSNDDNDFWNLIVDAINGGTNPANYDSQTMPYYTDASEAGPVVAKLRNYPNNFIYSGYFRGSSAYGRGSGGDYWSFTAYDYSSSYAMDLNNSPRAYPGTANDSKYEGHSIRCTVSAST